MLISLTSCPIERTSPVISWPGVNGSFVPLSARVILFPFPRSKNPSVK